MLDAVAVAQPIHKLRLFACACCSRIPGLSPASRTAIDAVAAARDGTGEVTDRAARLRTAAEEIGAAEVRFEAWRAQDEQREREGAERSGVDMFYSGVQFLIERYSRDGRINGARAVAHLLNDEFVAAVAAWDESQCWEDQVRGDLAWVAAEERRAQAALMREVIGNPFRPVASS